MNIREALLEEHSKKQTAKITRYIGSDKKRFAQLIKLFLEDEYRVVQRAAWVLSYCAENDPGLVKPYLEKLLNNLDNTGLHDAVKRNTLRIFEVIDAPAKLQGKLVDLCFRTLAGQEPIAMKAYSITILLNICKKEPDLKNELRLMIEGLMPYGSAAVKVRGRKALKELEKI
jgi:hypothetical protein